MEGIKNLMRHEIYDFEIQILFGFLRLAFRTWDDLHIISNENLFQRSQLSLNSTSLQSPHKVRSFAISFMVTNSYVLWMAG